MPAIGLDGRRTARSSESSRPSSSRTRFELLIAMISAATGTASSTNKKSNQKSMSR
jgi:hypothetical protein